MFYDDACLAGWGRHLFSYLSIISSTTTTIMDLNLHVCLFSQLSNNILIIITIYRNCRGQSLLSLLSSPLLSSLIWLSFSSQQLSPSHSTSPRKLLSHLPFFCYPSHILLHSLPKDTFPLREAAVASTASILAGFGVVALFCSVGVNL